MPTITTAFLGRLESRRENLIREAEQWVQGLPEGTFSPAAEVQYRQFVTDIQGLTQHIADTRSELDRMGSHTLKYTGSDAMTYGRAWAEQVSEKLHRMSGGAEKRAVVSGSIDIPSWSKPRSCRSHGHSGSSTYSRIALRWRELVRVLPADRARQQRRARRRQPVKPTSVFTVEPVIDRCRVIAHLSEPTPVRLWDDHTELQNWLTAEMVGGVLDALEDQVIRGDGTGENSPACWRSTAPPRSR